MKLLNRHLHEKVFKLSITAQLLYDDDSCLMCAIIQLKPYNFKAKLTQFTQCEEIKHFPLLSAVK